MEERKRVADDNERRATGMKPSTHYTAITAWNARRRRVEDVPRAQCVAARAGIARYVVRLST